MLIHRQNSYAPRGKQRTRRHELVNNVKRFSVYKQFEVFIAVCVKNAVF
jgi:hypothetical protein